MGTRGLEREPALTPEQRLRSALPRKTVFTAHQAGAEVQRRFRARLRLAFGLSVLAGLAPLWLVALLPAREGRLAPLLLAAGALFALVFAARLRLPRVQAACHLLGILALGAAVGALAPRGQGAVSFLLHPSLLLAAPLLGSSLVAALVRRELPAWLEFLLAGLWLAPAGALLILFPAGEWVLLGSGGAALLLLFLVQVGIPESLPVYPPTQAARAAVDAVPLALLGLGRRLLGRV